MENERRVNFHRESCGKPWIVSAIVAQRVANSDVRVKAANPFEGEHDYVHHIGTQKVHPHPVTRFVSRRVAGGVIAVDENEAHAKGSPSERLIGHSSQSQVFCVERRGVKDDKQHSLVFLFERRGKDAFSL